MTTFDGSELVSWKGVLKSGFQLIDDDIDSLWLSRAGCIYNEGYICLREMQDETLNTSIFRASCKLYSSAIKKPLFECCVETDNSLPQVFTGTNHTGAMLKVFNCTRITPKRKGNRNHYLFGLHRKDAVEVIKMAAFKNKNDIKSRDTRTMVDNKVNDTLQFVSLGDVNFCNGLNAFIVQVGSKQIYVPPGFESVRNVKLNDNSSVPLHCKVEQADGEPLFTCVTTEKPEFSVSSFKISAVVRTALKKLDITASRRWPGCDFFGLTRSDIFAQMESKQNVFCEEKEKEGSFSNILKDVLNVRHRDAGPTHSLCRKAQKHRNELIHDLVQFATFGEFKGIYNYNIKFAIYFFFKGYIIPFFKIQGYHQ